MDNVRVRIAPSPTGKFHIGTARTALFNYLFAKKNGGKFIVRIEDTDRERNDDVYVKDIIDGLLWLGLGFDEGPEVGGPYGPYFQSERLDLYKPYVEQLLKEHLAYRCYCTAEELTKVREADQKKGLAPKYSGRCRDLTASEVDKFEREGRASVIRFRTEPRKVKFTDLIRDEVEFDVALFGDFVIVRSDGTPLFVLSNVIDDSLMKISHVLRGEEHLANTAKQIILAQALNILSPEFGHFPLIFNPDRTKMSKRKDPVSVSDDFRAKGYLPEAMVNFMALLGWSGENDREIYTLPELAEEFELERVGKSPSVFDIEKLKWMNGCYIRNASIGEVASEAQNFIIDKKLLQATLDKPDFYLETIALVRDRLKTYADIEEAIELFYAAPKYDAELLVAKKSTVKNAQLALIVAEQTLKQIETFSLDELEPSLRGAAASNQLTDGELLWAVRAALSGRAASPGCFELLGILDKEESLKRIATAIKKLQALGS